MRTAVTLLALVALSACARSEDASTLPSDSNGLAPTATPARPAEGEEDELAIGEWRDSIQDDAQALEFGPAGAPPLFSMRCDARRGVVLQRHGIPLSGDLPMMMVTIGNDTRRLAVSGSTGSVPMLRAAITPRDPLLATLAQEGSPIIVRVGDAPPLVLPPSPAIGEFVSLCSAGGGQSREETVNAAAPEENAISAANEVAPAR